MPHCQQLLLNFHLISLAQQLKLNIANLPQQQCQLSCPLRCDSCAYCC
jgi:hypothetical protein